MGMFIAILPRPGGFVCAFVTVSLLCPSEDGLEDCKDLVSAQPHGAAANLARYH